MAELLNLQELMVFDDCEVCGAGSWAVVYKGAVRAGSFGNFTDADAVVGQCTGCGVERLAESYCVDSSVYETTHYRSLLNQGTDAVSFLHEYDSLQGDNLSVFSDVSARGKVVMDVGCAAGSFLDHVSGMASKTIAIEPCVEYHESLRQRGHLVYSDVADAARDLAGQIDLACSYSVIEHVDDPKTFLEEIAVLLKPGEGRLLVSTPNRNDVLMTLLPDDYPSFFYRTVHRWYFDQESFGECALRAGLTVQDFRCLHRFGLANAMRWLRDRRPGGRANLAAVSDEILDAVWRKQLEKEGVGDYLFFWMSPAAAARD